MNDSSDRAQHDGDTVSEPSQASSTPQSEAPAKEHRAPAVLSLDAVPKEARGPSSEPPIHTSHGLTKDVLEEKTETVTSASSNASVLHDKKQQLLGNEFGHAPSSANHDALSRNSDQTTPREEDVALFSQAASVATAGTAKTPASTAVSPSSPPPPQPPVSSRESMSSSSHTNAASSASPFPSLAAFNDACAAAASIRKWKDSKDYLKLQREMHRILSAMDRTPLMEWATQASLLSQLHKAMQTFKDVIGAVELPDGGHFAKSLWRALSPQNVVGVQRKALEVLQTYLEFVNPAYPMTKDLPLFLPALLELLPQATMQVKGDILELLDCGVVRRMPPSILRSCAEGLFVALLNCLEESETSPMYHRAMTLLKYVHATLKRGEMSTSTTTAKRMSPTSLHSAELRGGQVIPAYAWVLIRDAASLRCPALSVMKCFIAQADVPIEMDQNPSIESERYNNSEADGTLPASPARQPPRPDWIGGDVQGVVSALLNSLQDTQEKTLRLALDVVALVCPLNGGGGGNTESSDANTAATWTSASASATFHSTGVYKELFSFEMKSLLVAAAVQLLGTRCGTPSVSRRIFQWLTVDPNIEGGDALHFNNAGAGFFCADDYNADGTMSVAGDSVASTSPSSNAYVRDVTSYILSQGFHMVVQHWQAAWAERSEDTGDVEDSGAGAVQWQVGSELSALQHTAHTLMYSSAPRLSSAPSVAAAFRSCGDASGGVKNTNSNNAFPVSVTDSSASVALATPLVWIRALLLLFRYRSPFFTNNGDCYGGEDNGVSGGSPTAALRSPQLNTAESASLPDATFPFLLHLAPLVLPSLSRLLVAVPSVLSSLSFHTQTGDGLNSNVGVGNSTEDEMWAAEVQEVLRILPWTSFVQLDVVTIRSVEKLIHPFLTQASGATVEEATPSEEAVAPSTYSSVEKRPGMQHLQRRVQRDMDKVFFLTNALEQPLLDATADQPLAAQQYVRASLDWSDAVTRLLGKVVSALAATLQKKEINEKSESQLPLLLSTANCLLRLLVQRMQQLMEPMLESVLATATATGTAVLGADFFSSLWSSVNAKMLCQLREATLNATSSIMATSTRGADENEKENQSDAPPVLLSLPANGTQPVECNEEVQKLLSRMHRTSLRFTSFLSQLHLRCQQQAILGVLLDSASKDSAGAREQDLTQQTIVWLTRLCETAANAAGAPLFFALTVRLMLDILCRARGCLLPEPAYHVLEPKSPASGDMAASVAFAESFLLAPVVRGLWDSCQVTESGATSVPPSLSTAEAPEHNGFSLSSVTPPSESLLVLIAISPACARCLDVYMLQSPIGVAAPRLVLLHRSLTDMRALRRRGRLISAAVQDSEALSELQDPSVLFLGLVTILDCLSSSDLGGASGLSFLECGVAESTRQLAREYLSQALVRDAPGVLIPLFFSFLCPLVLPSASEVPQKDGTAEGSGGMSTLHGLPVPALAAIPLTVLLPTTRRNSAVTTASRPKREKETQDRKKNRDEAPMSGAARVYRYLEAPELVRYLLSLLQLPSSGDWVRQAMQVSTPNSLRVLLRGLEAQSFMTPEGRKGNTNNSGSTPPTARTTASVAAPAREGSLDTLLAATAMLVLNLSRQSLLSLNWSYMRLRDQAGESRAANSSSLLVSLVCPGTAAYQQRILFDSLACLNRLLELSQSGPRMQPHRAAVLTWQFTCAQFLPLLRLAVQADLYGTQVMLLDHIRGVLLYFDDVTNNDVASSSPADGQTFRHWRHHALLHVGVAAAGQTDGLFLRDAPLPEPHSAIAESSVNETVNGRSNGVAQAKGFDTSSTPVLDDLKRVPPAVLSNKVLYAMIGEVFEHVLYNIYEAENATKLLNVAFDAHYTDTLALWLRFYCDIMPYLYRDLVPSVDVVVNVLLSALERTTPQTVNLQSTGISTAVKTRIHCMCYATLAYMVRFLYRVARAADVENFEMAVKTKESMSWIASTFSHDDPVAQARDSPMWTRSPILAPIRGFLNRLVTAAVRTLRVCDAQHCTATASNITLNKQRPMWNYCNNTAEENNVIMGWKGLSRSMMQQQNSPTADLREHARDFIRLLSHSAGPQFLTAFVHNWCDAYAAQSSLWMFETVLQRQHRLRRWRNTQQQQCGQRSANCQLGNENAKPDDAQVLMTAWYSKEEAQRTAYLLLEDIGVSVVDVTAALAPLLCTAVAAQQRAERQQPKAEGTGSPNNSSTKKCVSSPSAVTAPRPPRVTQLLFFLNQIIEAVCVKRLGGGLTEQETEAVLAVTADVLSRWPPEALSFCCILHMIYCMVAYVGETAAAVDAGKGTAAGSPGKSAALTLPVTPIKIYQSKDYLFTLCRLLEGLSLSSAMSHRSAVLLLLHLLCSTFHAVLPSPLNAVENPGRIVDAVTRVFQCSLLPVLRRGIASVSEADILSSAPLVNASLRVLRAAICGFAPDLTFEKRSQNDIISLFFSEHFFRYSRSALHEWKLLLRQMSFMDHEFHSLLCERIVPSPGRLSVMMMSRETEAQLWARSMKSLAFYTYAVMVLDNVGSTAASAASSSAASTSAGTAPSVGASSTTIGPGQTMSAIRQKELFRRLREQLTYAVQRFSTPATPTAAQIEKKEVFLQPLCSAFLVFRVLLMSSVAASPVASLWPLVWPELLRALSIGVPATPALTISTKGEGAAKALAPQVGTEALQTILNLQMEALKVLDVDYTLYPAHALAFRWLFADDAALTNLFALQHQQQCLYHGGSYAKNALLTHSPFAVLLQFSTVRRLPLVSHLEVLHLLKKATAAPTDVHLRLSTVMNAVHEPRAETVKGKCSDLRCECGSGSGTSFAPVLSTIQQCWPLCARPSAADSGLRRPLYNIPFTHYPRLDGIHRAAQAFTVLLQRVNGDSLPYAVASELNDAQSLLLLQMELSRCVGHHNEVDMAYMQDLVEADLTTTDPDTML